MYSPGSYVYKNNLMYYKNQLASNRMDFDSVKYEWL